jgi:ubiquitin C-terminal hydrolase
LRTKCLSHATPLTRYFLSNSFANDTNYTNPLGAGGKLAQAYGQMIKEIWMRKQKGSISPTSLKRAIATFAPRFVGVSQHDSQEFLAFLLDG